MSPGREAGGVLILKTWNVLPPFPARLRVQAPHLHHHVLVLGGHGGQRHLVIQLPPVPRHVQRRAHAERTPVTPAQPQSSSQALIPTPSPRRQGLHHTHHMDTPRSKNSRKLLGIKSRFSPWEPLLSTGPTLRSLPPRVWIPTTLRAVWKYLLLQHVLVARSEKETGREAQ